MANTSKWGNRKPWFSKRPKINPKLVSRAGTLDNNSKYGYAGFNLYFPGISEADAERSLKYITKFEIYIKSHKELFSLDSVQNTKTFALNYKQLISDDEISKICPELTTMIVSETEFCLKCLGLAMHQIITKESTKEQIDEKINEENTELALIKAIIVNYEPIQQIKDIRVNNYNKLVSVKGTVIKAGNVKITCQNLAFSCASCNGIQVVQQTEGIYMQPSKCLTEDCKSRSNFTPLHSSSHTQTIAWKSIKIQELIGDKETENARVPRTLECELIGDQVNSCIPGDDVTITGVVKNRSSNTKCNQNALFSLYLDVISVVNDKIHTLGSYGASERITFNTTDYYAIEKIHEEPQLFRFLVHSFCPHIYGNEMVKAGLLLAIFGGTRSDRARAESHVLMVGDPGLGKSQMLQACTNVAPRGVYVCGNTSTGTGLTVTMAKESSGEYTLEAGALMLADQGCCCIDEFDKMPTQHACLLEAMEQQTISIAKAGMVCSLPTKTTILAAANPAGGHYDKSRTVSENLKISSPMLSRFDLIFILLDQPNEDRDRMMSDHVLALHSGGKVTNRNMDHTLPEEIGNRNTLKDKLLLLPGEQIDHLPHSLFRKYVAYAQKYVSPKLSEEAKTVLKSFYVDLRKQFKTGDCTPITTRQLNSLIRLSQARAKAELREEVTEEDAQDVIEVVKETIIDIFTDDVGILDTTRCQMGSGMSTKNQIMQLLSLMQSKSEAQAKSIFTRDEIKDMCNNIGIPRIRFQNVLESLNIQGFLCMKGSNRYQLVSAAI